MTSNYTVRVDNVLAAVGLLSWADACIVLDRTVETYVKSGYEIRSQGPGEYHIYNPTWKLARHAAIWPEN